MGLSLLWVIFEGSSDGSPWGHGPWLCWHRRGSTEAGQGQMSGFKLSYPRGDNVMSSRRGPLHPQQEQSWDDVLIHLLYVRDSICQDRTNVV